MTVNEPRQPEDEVVYVAIIPWHPINNSNFIGSLVLKQSMTLTRHSLATVLKWSMKQWTSRRLMPHVTKLSPLLSLCHGVAPPSCQVAVACYYALSINSFWLPSLWPCVHICRCGHAILQVQKSKVTDHTLTLNTPPPPLIIFCVHPSLCSV